LETDGAKIGDMIIHGTGQESQPDTVCGLVIISSQPPKEERRLA
jgi:hypothetical protein